MNKTNVKKELKKTIEKIEEEVINTFDKQEKNILAGLKSSYGKYRAERIFVEEYKKSGIPVAVSLRRIRVVRENIENIFKEAKDGKM
jgi:pyrimidine operon attenuation protein/uracil phosphoribosyltransferase